MDLSPTLALLIDAVPIGLLLFVLYALRSRRRAADGATRDAEASERGLRSWERLPRSTERRVTAVDPESLRGGGSGRPPAKPKDNR